jgi:hypothetical protein
MADSRTSELRQRQLHAEDMKCGNQPANIRMISRRFNDPASINDLENIAIKTSFQIKIIKEGGLPFLS